MNNAYRIFLTLLGVTTVLHSQGVLLERGQDGYGVSLGHVLVANTGGTFLTLGFSLNGTLDLGVTRPLSSPPGNTRSELPFAPIVAVKLPTEESNPLDFILSASYDRISTKPHPESSIVEAGAFYSLAFSPYRRFDYPENRFFTLFGVTFQGNFSPAFGASLGVSLDQVLAYYDPEAAWGVIALAVNYGKIMIPNEPALKFIGLSLSLVAIDH
jgi:hypothetical protein